jgi:Asp-tRNA(Asn)/Glu-tRNA(Gln) amidotransferase A subunit family amidase
VTAPQAQPSAVAWLARLAAGECSSRELVASVLARLDAVEPALGAVVARDDGWALDAADAADAQRRRGGGPPAPLLGLPLTIKDALDVAGMRTTGGSLARAAYVAGADATAVARVRAAGAIVVAKTNVPEACSSFETDNVVHGLTRNPLDPDRTPGGSSGGEAAVLGADASIAGIGTDGGGSIRVPAHYVGVVGLRPTTGRVPETGVWPATRASGTMDFTCVGPMARAVEDLGLLLGVIAGADGVDPYAVDVPLGDWRQVDPTRLRVAFYDDHPRVPATTPGTRDAVHRAARALADLGCAVEQIAPVDGAAAATGRSATELFFAAAGADGGAALLAAVGGPGGRHHPQFQALLDGAAAAGTPSAASFFAVQREVFAYRARVRAAVAAYDVVLSPVVAGPAPRHGQPPAGLPKADELRYEAFEYVHVNALAGVPAASVPVGVEDGMPVGVQIAGPAWREDLVLAAAAALEGAFGGFAVNRRLAAAAGVPTDPQEQR